ncbi:S-layer homology domain-containing protein, partial [bacterium]|nr:S-layer homology domain-containing protein [bacterium]
MRKTTQALSLTLALFLTCANVMAKDCCKQEKVQVYAHPSLMNADATEVKDANYVYRIGGKVLKQKNRLGFTNKENLYVNAFSRDLLNAMSVRKGDKDFDIKMPVSRSEIAFMLANGLNMKDLGYHKNYTDVTASYWADSEIKTATAADVMIGYPDKSFKPDQAITKAEVFAVVAKLIDVPYTNDGSAPVFNGKKIENIPTWAYGCTKEVVASGLLANVPDVNSLLAAPYLSRQQVATLISELRIRYGANGKLIGDAFANSGAPVAVKVKMLDRIDAKHSNIGDRFLAKTTEEAVVQGITFPTGSIVEGRVVTVQRPGLGKYPGSVTVKFTKIKNGDTCAELPKELTSATADCLKNPNIVARILGLPFTAAGR